MMLEMSTMGSAAMMHVSDSQHAQMDNSGHSAEMPSMADHCQSQNSANDGCVEHQDCGACLAHCSGAMITEILSFTTSKQVDFESDYRLWLAPSTYSRLLRPPKNA